jgi:GTP-binding protein HflX
MPKSSDRTSIKVQSERAIVAAVRLPHSVFDERDPFGELKALAEQAGAVIVGELEQRKQKPESATFIGKGKLGELKGLCEATGATLVIFDHDLSPRQIANIEEAVGRKVIDRSELILDIFASRATTHEAKLQVELAQMEYTYPRLRAMWDHLERLVGRGGIGGIGTRGPGEQQLEIDRRLVQNKKLDLKRELETINARKRRAVAERKLDHFTVGLVGYTNAGKSTLFNSLTAGGAYADDRLFATLVTRTREWDLGGGLRVMLSDTVGFVRALPHHLVASFRATLEEAVNADLLLILLDVSDPAAEMHYDTVESTLNGLLKGAGIEPGPRRVLLLNKVDRLKDNRDLLVWQRKVPGCIPIIAKAVGGRGHVELTDLVREAAQGGVEEVVLRLDMHDAKAVSVVENRSQVLKREYDDGHVLLTVRIGRRQLDQLKSVTGGAVRVLPRRT